MNLRHAAALVFMGWYLLAPPPSLDWQHAKRPLDSLRPDAPLSEWIIWGSFDSARECQNQKDEDVGEATKALGRLQFPRNDNPDDFYAEMMAARMLAECIATDDPRLMKK
jgi:hypothetical protein